MLLHTEKDRNRKYFNYCYIPHFFQKEPIIFISGSLLFSESLLSSAKIIVVC